MQFTVDNAKDPQPSPPQILEASEAPSAFENLLASAVTPDERRWAELADALLDEAWRFGTGKALRGELRRLWLAEGRSKHSYYKAFCAICERRKA